MEEAQYVRSRGATMMGPDAAIMLHHDWRRCCACRRYRWAGALFSTNLSGALLAPIEMAMVAGGYRIPRSAVLGGTNAWGDHTGHTAALGAAYRAELARARPWHATAAAIRNGYGTRLIVRFVTWARAHGVRVIGGLPTEFADSPMPAGTLAAIRDTYLDHGALFVALRNHSDYPRTAFFDTPDHLDQHWQIIHSRMLAKALAPNIAPRQVVA